MVKPIELDELLLRVRALLRRANIEMNRKLSVGNLELDADAMTAAFNAYSAEILAKNKRPSVLKTLHKLIDAVRDIPAKVVSRDKQREQSR